jgi:hypothetical protein
MFLFSLIVSSISCKFYLMKQRNKKKYDFYFQWEFLNKKRSIDLQIFNMAWLLCRCFLSLGEFIEVFHNHNLLDIINCFFISWLAQLTIRNQIWRNLQNLLKFIEKVDHFSRIWKVNAFLNLNSTKKIFECESFEFIEGSCD